MKDGRSVPTLMILLIVSVLLPRDVLFAQDGDGSFTPGEVRRDPMGFEMVYVPGATFEIGITPDRLREVCRDRGEDDLDHCVEVMEEDAGATFRETMVIPPFWIDRYEVTGEQFETVCQTMASSVRGSFPTFYFETCCA